MRIAVGRAGVDARRGDLDVDGRAVGILLVRFDRPFHVLEAAAHGREHHVLHRELDARVCRVDLPGRRFCHRLSSCCALDNRIEFQISPRND
jgi:hypothetical protein